MVKKYDFDEQLGFGLKWESDLSGRLESILTRKRVENIDYLENPEIQRSGIDAILSDENPAIDTKVQRNGLASTGNLPIEVWSVEEESEPGWFYTGESELVVWAYENKAANNLLPTGYFMLKDEFLVEWFNDNHQDFRRHPVPNEGRYGEYTTIIRLVPIEDFPPNHLVEFNPMMVKNKETDQYELAEFLDD